MRVDHRALLVTVLIVAAGDARAQTSNADATVQALLSAASTSSPELSCDRFGPGSAQALIDVGQKATRESLDRLTTVFRLAERAARCAGSDTLAGAALNALSDTLLERGQLDASLAAARESVAILERAKDEAGLAEAWNRVGNVYAWILDTHAAHEAFTRALEHTASDDRIGQARVWNNLGNVHKAAAEFDVALDYYRRAQRVFTDLGDLTRAAVVINNIGDVYFRRGEYRTALEYNQRALEMNRAVGNQVRVARSLDLAANTYRMLGAYQRALHLSREALEIRTRVDDRNGAMETTHNIGLVYFSQGDYALAIDAFKRGIHLNEVWGLRDDSLVAEALHNIALAAWRLGQHGRAAANLRDSLAIAERANQPTIAAAALHDLGQEALENGRPAVAAPLFDRALEIRRRIGDQAGITETLAGQAATKLAAGNADAALSLAERAVDNATMHDQVEPLWNAQTLVGIAYRRLGRPDQARRALNAAIATIERLSTEVVISDNLRQQFFESTLSPYHELIALLVDRHDYGDALEVAERSKARALIRLLQRGPIDEDAVLDADEKRERQRLRDTLVGLNRDINDAQTAKVVDKTRVSTIESTRHTTREALAALDTRLQAAHPELAAARGRLAPLQRSEMNAVFTDTDTAIVEYVFADRALYTFVLTSDGHAVSVDQHTTPIDRTDVERRMSRFLSRIGARDFGVLDDARAMYALLIGPVAPAIAGKSHLVIVPDGPLWNVPFQALRGPNGYLIEAASVAYAPSVSVLRAMQRLPRSAGPRSVLAIGQSRFASSHLEPLPDVERQVREIRAIYGVDRSMSYLGDDATERRFKTDASRYSVLHLATHAVLDEASPMYSHLVLSPASDRSGDDGELEAWEVMGMRLHADLVVLAACETGRGRIASGEGVIGEMWAWFAAGARALVVSQFRVESSSATTMLLGFHTRVATGRGSKADHLRAATLDLLHTPRFAHPYYWAGFVLVGDSD